MYIKQKHTVSTSVYKNLTLTHFSQILGPHICWRDLKLKYNTYENKNAYRVASYFIVFKIYYWGDKTQDFAIYSMSVMY